MRFRLKYTFIILRIYINMTKTLYYINACPGARAVRLFSRYSQIHIHEKLINLKEGEHMKEYFLKLNPMHNEIWN